MDGWGRAIVVCGPTATGKSEMALALARKFGGEVVSADSMQVYRGLVVGTAALTAEEAGGVPVHLSGFLPPEERFSVAQWLAMARACMAGIWKRGAVPVVCGGTGLYIKSLMDGIDFSPAEGDSGLHVRLEDEFERLGGAAMLEKLAENDPERAAKLNPADRKRIVRALEQQMVTGLTAGEREAMSRRGGAGPEVLCLGLNYPQRAQLYEAINVRVDAMMMRGLLDEARVVFESRERYRTAVQAIGYKEFFPWFEGEAKLEDCVARLKQATRNYAKRQLTWFGKMDGVHWLEVGQPGAQAEALMRAEAFLSA